MPFKKGHKKIEGSGTKVGDKHGKTKAWESIADSMTTTHADRFNRILNTADDKTFSELYIKILEFFKPKYSRAEVTGKDGAALQTIINIHNTKALAGDKH